MAKKLESASPSLGRALESAKKLDVVRTRRSQNSTTAKGLKEEGGNLESLSGIYDAEVSKYLNNEKQAHYKRVIWEIMNRDYVKGNNQKRAKTEKKAGSRKKVAKPSPCGVNKEKRLSSKINYDVLDKLNDDDGVDNAREEDHRHIESRQENEKSDLGDDVEDEFEHENSGSEECNDDVQNYSGTMYPEIDDEEYAGYDEEYGYEEY